MRKNGLEKTPIIDAQQELLIEVLSVLLRGKSKAKDCATIDVYLTKDSQSKHCTIYRVEVVGPINYFRSKLVVQRDETLVVVYAEKTNNKLKGTLRINEFAKEVGENGLQEIYLINEKGVVGGSVKIALKQKQTSVKVNVQ